jgi:hypothetical protein
VQQVQEPHPGPPQCLYALHHAERLVLSVPGRGPQNAIGQKAQPGEPDRLFEIAERGGYKLNLEGRQALQQGKLVGLRHDKDPKKIVREG